MCPPQDGQDILRLAGVRRTIIFWQCGQTTFCPTFLVENWILPPQKKHEILIKSAEPSDASGWLAPFLSQSVVTLPISRNAMVVLIKASVVCNEKFSGSIKNPQDCCHPSVHRPIRYIAKFADNKTTNPKLQVHLFVNKQRNAAISSPIPTNSMKWPKENPNIGSCKSSAWDLPKPPSIVAVPPSVRSVTAERINHSDNLAVSFLARFGEVVSAIEEFIFTTFLQKPYLPSRVRVHTLQSYCVVHVPSWHRYTNPLEFPL